MQANGAKMNPSKDSTAVLPTPNFDVLADLVQTIGSVSFFREIGDVIGCITPYDNLLFFLYRQDAAPMLLSNTNVDKAFQQGLENYLDHTYLLNPVYQAFKSGVTSGAYMMSDLLPDGYGDLIKAVEFRVKIDTRETIGYLTPGWPRHTEELLLLVCLPDDAMIEVTILRDYDTGFSKQDFGAMQQIFPVILAVFCKHWTLANQNYTAQPSRPSLDTSFDDFGADVLTDREKEVVKLVLTGHSSESISLRLGTSVPTIKSHRRNIYAKLKIGSQAELFSRFIGFLTSRPRS